MKKLLGWIVDMDFYARRSKIIKIVLGIFLVSLLILYWLYSMGANAIANSPVAPEVLAKIDECQLRVLKTDKGLITYASLAQAANKCDQIEKSNVEYKQMVIQRAIVNERLEEINGKKEEDKKDVEK